MNRFFEKEFIPGKGMKNAGIGGLIIGNHYEKKQIKAEKEQDKIRNAKWLENYHKRAAEERAERIRLQELRHKQKLAEETRKLKLKFKRAARRAKEIQDADDDSLEGPAGLDLNSEGSLALDSRDASEYFMINGGSDLDDMSILLPDEDAKDQEKDPSVHYIGMPTPPPAVISHMPTSTQNSEFAAAPSRTSSKEKKSEKEDVTVKEILAFNERQLKIIEDRNVAVKTEKPLDDL